MKTLESVHWFAFFWFLKKAVGRTVRLSVTRQEYGALLERLLANGFAPASVHLATDALGIGFAMDVG